MQLHLRWHVTGGAYGFRLVGLDARELVRGSDTDNWLRISVRQELEPPDPDTSPIETIWMIPGRDHVTLHVNDVRVLLDRRSRSATVVSATGFEPSELLHPYMQATGAVFARWAGRETFHAGAFLRDGVAWALIGDKTVGKSTTLAWLSRAGYPVLVDDLLVLEGRTAFAGPRCIDLRDPTASKLGVLDVTAPSRAGTRRRLSLPSVPAETWFAGWIFLEWGRELRLEKVPPAERLARLHRLRTVALPGTDPVDFLDLASLPMWRLTRPRSWDGLLESAEALLSATAR